MTQESYRNQYYEALLGLPWFLQKSAERMFNPHETSPIVFKEADVEFKINPFSPQNGEFLEVSTINSDFQTTVLVYSNRMGGKLGPETVIYSRNDLYSEADEVFKVECLEGAAAQKAVEDHIAFVHTTAVRSLTETT